MLKLNYENKSDIPTGLEQYYAEKDGVFALQAEGVKTDADVSALKDALDKERGLRRDAEKKAKEYESKYSLLPDDFNVDEYNRLKDTNRGDDIDARLKEQRERITAQFEKEKAQLASALEEKESLIKTHILDSSIQRAINEANVAKQFAPAVEAMFKNKATIEGSNVFLEEMPVGDFFKEWANSDEGKHFIAASQNTGGGSNGARSGEGAAKTIKRAEFDALSQNERRDLALSGAKVID